MPPLRLSGRRRHGLGQEHPTSGVRADRRGAGAYRGRSSSRDRPASDPRRARRPARPSPPHRTPLRRTAAGMAPGRPAVDAAHDDPPAAGGWDHLIGGRGGLHDRSSTLNAHERGGGAARAITVGAARRDDRTDPALDHVTHADWQIAARGPHRGGGAPVRPSLRRPRRTTSEGGRGREANRERGRCGAISPPRRVPVMLLRHDSTGLWRSW